MTDNDSAASEASLITTHSELAPSSVSSVVESQQEESRYTAVCVPCGHSFYGTTTWQEWIDTTIQRQEQDQISFCAFMTLAQRQRGQCPLCHDTVACVVRSYTNIPCRHPISMLNNLIHDSSSLALSSSMQSSVLSQNDIKTCDTVPSTRSGQAYMPNCILVTGAGNPDVNGMYWWNGAYGFNNSNRYIRAGVWKNMLCYFNIFLCQLRSLQQSWFISIVTDYDNYKDIDFYRTPLFVSCSSAVPPRDGWKIFNQGYEPIPKFRYQLYDSATGHIQEIVDPPSFISALISPSIVVDGAGNSAVNGTYVHEGFFKNAKMYVRDGLWNNSRYHFYIYLCD